MDKADEDVWEVVGGALEGGILVRTGIDFASPLEESRLSRGTLVRALEVVGNRMLFRRISGTGPSTGWVSLVWRRTPLLAWRGTMVQHPCDSLFDWDALEQRETHETRRRARSLPSKRHHRPSVVQISPMPKSPSAEAQDRVESLEGDASASGDEKLIRARSFSTSCVDTEDVCDLEDEQYSSNIAGADVCDVASAPAAGLEAMTAKVEDAHEKADSRTVPVHFAKWDEHRTPLLRMSPALVGRAWDFPLAKSEKRELLLLHVAAGERASADAAIAAEESAAYEAAERSHVEAQLLDTTRALRNQWSRSHSQWSQSGGLAKKNRRSFGRKAHRVSIA